MNRNRDSPRQTLDAIASFLFVSPALFAALREQVPELKPVMVGGDSGK